MPGEIPECIVERGQNNAVYFHAENGFLVERQRAQDVSAGADTDDEHFRVVAHHVAQVDHVELQVAKFGQVAVEMRHHRFRIAVDVQVEAIDRHIRLVCAAHAPAEGHLLCLRISMQRYSGERIPLLEQWRRLELELHPLHSQNGHLLGAQRRPGQARPHKETCKHGGGDPQGAFLGNSKTKSRERGQRRHEQNGGKSIDRVEQQNQEHAAARCSQQIRCIEPADVLLELSQQQAYADAAENERQ